MGHFVALKNVVSHTNEILKELEVHACRPLCVRYPVSEAVEGGYPHFEAVCLNCSVRASMDYLIRARNIIDVLSESAKG
jgi:hypothetical protein